MAIDTSRAARSRGAYTALVEAIVAAPVGEPETLALEWKQGTPLIETASLARIAKAILGFSNRHPDTAARAFEGCAYLVLGAEPQSVTGIAREDFEQLEKKLRIYTGPEIDWEPRYVEVQNGTPVLVVTVEAPNWGDPIYPLRKAMDKAANGTVFVRHPGRTEIANAADIDMLNRRVAYRAGSELDITAQPQRGAAFRPISLTVDDVDDYLQREKTRLLASLSSDGPANALQTTGIGATMRQFAGGEHRTPDAYRHEVERYLSAFRKAMNRFQDRILAHELSEISLEIVNTTDHPFEKVEVEIELRIEGPALLASESRLDPKRTDLPEPPVLFGHGRPPARSFVSGLGDISMPFISPVSIFGPTIDELGPGHWHVVFSPTTVRAAGSTALSPLYLVTPSTSPISVAWEATATNAQGRRTGQFEVPASDNVITLDEVLQPIKSELTAAEATAASVSRRRRCGRRSPRPKCPAYLPLSRVDRKPKPSPSD